MNKNQADTGVILTVVVSGNQELGSRYSPQKPQKALRKKHMNSRC